MAALMIYLMDISESEFLARGIDRQIARIADEEKGNASVWITGSAYVKADVALPVLLSGATAAAGFLSLAVSPLVAIREFGLYVTAGVVATLLISLSFAPAVLQLLSPPPRRQG